MWSNVPFEQARDEDKMILLDVGMEGCTACRWMDEFTYTDARVIELVNKHFIAIVADAEAQPDIGERYSDWAWPATIFMAPDSTQVLALSGNRRPDNFIPILNELIEKKAGNQLQADKLAPYSAPPEPETTELTQLRNRVRGQLDRLLNEEYGGWRSNGISTAGGARIEHLYLRAHMFSNAELQTLALKSTEGYLRALDPVWGGVFVSAFHDRTTTPKRFQGLGVVPEKRISNQANALIAFSHAYRVSSETRYLNAINEFDRFLQEWMQDEDGTFYTSQEDDPPGLTENMNAIDYWRLDSDKKRRAFGIPPFDHAVYTDKNAQTIVAYAFAYETTGKKAYLQTALRAAEVLVRDRWTEQNWVLQARASDTVKRDKRIRPLVSTEKPFLSAQAWFGTALLALYRASSDEQWLKRAEQLADTMLEKLYDNKTGGFFSSVPDATASVIAPRKPLELNARAAHFFYDLGIYTKNEKYTEIPEATIRAVAVPEILKREGKIIGETAMALEKLTAAYFEFSVVGDKNDSATRALFNAGQHAYHPRKLLHLEKAGRYPERKKAAMYICNPDRCSIPIEDPSLVAKQADSFRLPASFSP